MFKSFVDLMLFFSLYSFLGWTIETSFKSIRDKKWVNSGFLTGPFCPIYGFGAIIIILLTNITNGFLGKQPLLFLFSQLVLSIVLTTALEYFVGFLLEKWFSCKWWDYSNEFLNLKGRICLKYSLAWGVLAFLLIYSIHPSFTSVMISTPLSQKYLLFSALLIYFIWDIVKSIRHVVNLKHIILVNYQIPLEQFKKQLLKYKRLYAAFPKLNFPHIGNVNQEIREFLNEKIEKLKVQLKNLPF